MHVLLQDEARRITHEQCFPRVLPHQIPDEPKDPRFPEPDSFKPVTTINPFTAKELEQQAEAAAAAQQPPHGFMPTASAAPDYYGQQPPPIQMQRSGIPAYPPGAMQQPGAHVPGPHPYPGPGQLGLQHQLAPQGLPRPMGPQLGGAFPGVAPAAPPQVVKCVVLMSCYEER